MVITEPLRYIQVQQCVGVKSHKQVMNKSVPTIGGTLENITPCTRTLWQLIEGSPWAECSRDIIIKEPVLVSLYSLNVEFASFVIIKGILHRESIQRCQASVPTVEGRNIWSVLWIAKGVEKAAAALPADQISAHPSHSHCTYKLSHLDINVKKWLPERSAHFNTCRLIPPSFHWIELNQAMA